MADTCGSCKHYIGSGDWNLCCDKMYDLCYERTPACDMYEYSEAKVLELKERKEQLLKWLEEQRRKNERDKA